MMTANLPLPGHDTDMNPRLLLLCMIVLLSATNVAHARTYLVEMVIFARSAGLGAEHWSSNPGFPAIGNAVELGAPGSGRFARLPASRMELNNIAATLKRKAGYQVLAHTGWVQPGLSAGKAIKVRIGAGPMMSVDVADTASGTSATEFGPQTTTGTRQVQQLQGTIKVSLAHYLHLTADLLYSAGRNGPRVRMKQSRRMRSQEIHYLDGPVLGIIVLMTPTG